MPAAFVKLSPCLHLKMVLPACEFSAAGQSVRLLTGLLEALQKCTAVWRTFACGPAQRGWNA